MYQFFHNHYKLCEFVTYFRKAYIPIPLFYYFPKPTSSDLWIFACVDFTINLGSFLRSVENILGPGLPEPTYIIRSFMGHYWIAKDKNLLPRKPLWGRSRNNCSFCQNLGNQINRFLRDFRIISYFYQFFIDETHFHFSQLNILDTASWDLNLLFFQGESGFKLIV